MNTTTITGRCYHVQSMLAGMQADLELLAVNDAIPDYKRPLITRLARFAADGVREMAAARDELEALQRKADR